MGDNDRRSCDPNGCASLQVIRKEVEFYADTLKETISGTKECIAATGEAQRVLTGSISELKSVIEGQAVALQAGTRGFNFINDELDRLRSEVHGIDTRLAVIERGGVPAGRSAAGYGAASGGIITVLVWLAQQFMGG